MVDHLRGGCPAHAAGVVSAPLVSIALVTRNGIDTLPAVLEALTRQTFDGAIEIVAIDSGSTDGSADLLRRRANRFVAIDPTTFNHGTTRNLAAAQAAGEYVVLLVQDAIPANDMWLARLVEPLRRDPRIAGTFARQVPHERAGALTRHYATLWKGASTAPHVAALDDPGEFESLPPHHRFDRCTFDNVCSCIRRSIWTQHPFVATPFAEDLEWARTVLMNGWAIAYAPDAVVAHSHERSAAYEFARTRILHRRLYQLFGLRTIPTAPLLARAVLSSLALHARVELSARSLALAFAWPLGQYLGGRDAARAVAR